MLEYKNVRSILCVSGFLVGLTLVSGWMLASSNVSAEDIIDDVSLAIPMACTVSGTGMDSHTADVANGTYRNNIGTTVLKAFCNDAEGFAIYAAGYTNDTIGETDSNKLVGTTSGIGNIVTGLATTAGNPDVSNWAMKLTVTGDSGITTGTDAFVIDSDLEGSFSDYHTVPNEYVKVAHKNSNTDMTANTGGATLTTTYAVYISKTQQAGTYRGKVIYTLVHPASAEEPVHPDQIGVIYHGNGLTFPGGATKNRVAYGSDCEQMYVGTTPTIVKSSNLNDDGSWNEAYSNESIRTPVTFSGADKVKVELTYGTNGTIIVASGSWDGDWGNMPDDFDYIYAYDDYALESESADWYGWYRFDGWETIRVGQSDLNGSGNKTYVFDGDTVTIYHGYRTASDDNNYGIYARVYPIYDTEQVGTEEELVCQIESQNGAYASTSTLASDYPMNRWYIVSDNSVLWFGEESQVMRYIENNKDMLMGSIMDVYAFHPYGIVFNGNNATAGTMQDFTIYADYYMADAVTDLLAPNFKKTGYGFAGWSENPNATVNSNDKIYGPNEAVHMGNLTFDSTTHEATLYAVWVPSNGNMQNFSCDSLASGQITALTDTRDNNVYTVGKMEDGRCWMMENLRLDAAYSADSSKANLFGGVFVGLADSEDENFSNSTTANSLYNTSNITGDHQAYRIPRYNNNNTNIGGTNSLGTTLVATPYGYNGNNYQWYGYGNYYNWPAAIANTGDFSGGPDSPYSICPKGWTLPKQRGSYGSFVALDIVMGGTGNPQSDYSDYSGNWEDWKAEGVSNRWRSYPHNFVYSGWFEGSVGWSGGEAGYYWSTQSSYYDHASIMYFSMSEIEISNTSIQISNPKYRGEAVRCINYHYWDWD